MTVWKTEEVLEALRETFPQSALSVNGARSNFETEIIRIETTSPPLYVKGVREDRFVDDPTHTEIDHIDFGIDQNDEDLLYAYAAIRRSLSPLGAELCDQFSPRSFWARQGD